MESAALTERAEWPAGSPEWTRFLASIVFPKPIGRDHVVVFALREEVEGEDALNRGAMNLGRLGPFEIDQ